MSDICIDDPIPPGTAKELQPLYECKNATKCLKETIVFNTKVSNENKIVSDNFEKDLKAYKLSKAEFDNKLDRWTKKIGEYAEYSQRDGVNRQFWVTEYDGTCWGGIDFNWGDASYQCHEKAKKQGYNGDAYFAKERGWCYSRYGNFLCKKPDDIVASEISEYMSKKPLFTLKEPKESDYAKKEQIPIDNIDINCCSNYINSSGSTIGNTQTCSEAIDEQIKNYPKTKPDIPIIPAGGISPLPPSGNNNNTDDSSGDFTISTEVIIAIVIAVLVLLSFSSGLAFLFIGK